jgi:hypothetical protein
VIDCGSLGLSSWIVAKNLRLSIGPVAKRSRHICRSAVAPAKRQFLAVRNRSDAKTGTSSQFHSALLTREVRHHRSNRLSPSPWRCVALIGRSPPIATISRLAAGHPRKNHVGTTGGRQCDRVQGTQRTLELVAATGVSRERDAMRHFAGHLPRWLPGAQSRAPA